MTALKPLGSAQREISLRHSLFEEAIALVRNSAVGVLVTAIQVIAGSACRNFSPPGPFLHSGLRPHFKKGLAVVHLGAETAERNAPNSGIFIKPCPEFFRNPFWICCIPTTG